MTLRARFVAASSAVAFVTLSGAFTAVWLVYGETQERQLDSILLAEAKADANAAYDPTQGEHLVVRTSNAEPIAKEAVVYRGGEPVAWTPNLTLARPAMDVVRHPLGAPFDLWWNNRHLRAVLVPVARDRDLSMLLATPRTDLDEDAQYLAGRMIAAVLAAVAASAALTFWLARMLTRDHVRIAAVARRVASGDLSARIGASSSDWEMAQLGRDIDEMISRLAVLVETQQHFIANASHELRSPITTLLGELSFALRRDRQTDSYRQSIEEALGSARRLKVLTEDLLTLARIGAGDFTRETVALSAVVRAATESSRAASETAKVTMEVTCDESAVEGHAGDLERLLRNLLENAVRHSPPGGRVRIEAHRMGNEARLAVSDEGPGIPSDVRERIFEPFFRLAADRRVAAGPGGPADPADHGGAGLGLAIGRSIARAHGGDLCVDASPRGARFVVRLPASSQNAEI